MERTFGPFTVRIDLTLCVGFGDCVDEAGHIFELTDDGAVRFRDAPPETAPATSASPAAEPTRALLVAACSACPVDALTLYDESGTQVAP